MSTGGETWVSCANTGDDNLTNSGLAPTSFACVCFGFVLFCLCALFVCSGPLLREKQLFFSAFFFRRGKIVGRMVVEFTSAS